MCLCVCVERVFHLQISFALLLHRFSFLSPQGYAGYPVHETERESRFTGPPIAPHLPGPPHKVMKAAWRLVGNGGGGGSLL